MEQLNYHKLVNLKKRFAKYDCEISKDILATIEKHLVIEKQKSINKIKSDYLDLFLDLEKTLNNEPE